MVIPFIVPSERQQQQQQQLEPFVLVTDKPKSNGLVLVTYPTRPSSFVRIRPRLFEISRSQTDRQTDRQTDSGENTTSVHTFGGGGNKRDEVSRTSLKTPALPPSICKLSAL